MAKSIWIEILSVNLVEDIDAGLDGVVDEGEEGEEGVKVGHGGEEERGEVAQVGQRRHAQQEGLARPQEIYVYTLSLKWCKSEASL